MDNNKKISKPKFCSERIKDPKLFDSKSFRTKVYRAHRITFGCPKGQWNNKLKVCKVPVQVQRILHPVGERICPVPGLEVKRDRKKKNLKATYIVTNPKKISEAEKEAVKLFIKGMKGDDIISILKSKYKLTSNWAKYVLNRAQRMVRGVIAKLPKKIKKVAKVGVGGILVPKNNPVELSRILESAAVKLYSEGVGKDSIIDELMRKYKISKDLAAYHAARAARIVRGKVKYVIPSTYKILTNFVNK